MPQNPPEPALRLADDGPRYTETPADPYAPDSRIPAEPWNTATASLFIALAVTWLVILRRSWRILPFLVSGLVILLAGGLGGTLYHAFRTRRIYFYLDLIPILALGVLAIALVCFRLRRWYGARRVLLAAAGVLAAFLLVNLLVFRVAVFESRTLPVNLSYVSQAVLMLIPIVVLLIRTRFRHAAYIAAGVVSFGIAWFFRLIDGTPFDSLPMGTHWLWHLFGALCTNFLIVYFVRMEGEFSPPAGSSR